MNLIIIPGNQFQSAPVVHRRSKVFSALNPPRISSITDQDVLTKQNKKTREALRENSSKLTCNAERIFAFNIIVRIKSIKLMIAYNF